VERFDILWMNYPGLRTFIPLSLAQSKLGHYLNQVQHYYTVIDGQVDFVLIQMIHGIQ
jgi:hypothetical protein